MSKVSISVREYMQLIEKAEVAAVHLKKGIELQAEYDKLFLENEKNKKMIRVLKARLEMKVLQGGKK